MEENAEHRFARNEVEERKLVGLEMVQITSENVKVIKEKLEVARDRAEKAMQTGGEEILNSKLVIRIHDVFHVSMLRKYISYPSHVLESQPVELKENLTHERRASTDLRHEGAGSGK
ncbi:putative DNA/RNA polymerase superfamily protein [Abeliophyllum distichum]|uniref:DNA/RNA polymerase superfamily protein n=1 Tax=Abeliophyllum distichum TaxID=126358 RepID=A0ABD1VYF4_9LAMI